MPMLIGKFLMPPERVPSDKIIVTECRSECNSRQSYAAIRGSNGPNKSANFGNWLRIGFDLQIKILCLWRATSARSRNLELNCFDKSMSLIWAMLDPGRIANIKMILHI